MRVGGRGRVGLVVVGLGLVLERGAGGPDEGGLVQGSVAARRADLDAGDGGQVGELVAAARLPTQRPGAGRVAGDLVVVGAANGVVTGGRGRRVVQAPGKSEK